MDESIDARALALLSRFCTPARLLRMHEVLAQRTRYITGVFENMYHAHNIHAALRSLECQGIQDVHIIDEYHTFRHNTSVTKGASYWLNIHRYPHARAGVSATATCVDYLRTMGYELYVADFDEHAYTPETLPLDKPLALVMGTEQKGISRQMRELATGTVMIPMVGFTHSYNVSVALSIIMYTLVRRVRQEVGDRARLTQPERDALILDWLRQEVKGSAALERELI